MSEYTIGEFARRTRLSPKALRIYGDLGLLVPARVDPDSGYRLYREEQVRSARLIAMLRALDMPLATIAAVLDADGDGAARILSAWWAAMETRTAERRALVAHLQTQLTGGTPTAMYDIKQRIRPARTIASISRHLHASETDAFFHEAFARLRALGPPLPGVAGAPYLVFYGEVSEDGDGPMELCRPVAAEPDELAARLDGGIEARRESEHTEAYVRLAAKDATWPAMLPACDALQDWAGRHDRQPAGALRQLLIADRRTATPSTLVIDLSVPVR